MYAPGQVSETAGRHSAAVYVATGGRACSGFICWVKAAICGEHLRKAPLLWRVEGFLESE